MDEAKQRPGDWIQTYKGLAFWPLDPRPEEIDIVDIAHSLSLKTRFNGQCKTFYSVADHSLNVCTWLEVRYPNEPKLYLAGLLHDASEAYLPDVPKPIKPLLTNFREIEDGILKVIFNKFDLKWEMDSRVKEADQVMLATEAEELMGNECIKRWQLLYPPDHSYIISPNNSAQFWLIEKEFINTFNLLITRIEKSKQ